MRFRPDCAYLIKNGYDMYCSKDRYIGFGCGEYCTDYKKYEEDKE